MRRKGNPSALLVGMQTGAATVQNSMEFPQKNENGTAFWSSDSTAGILYPMNPETPIQKNLCTPMFIAAQFTIAKYWKQPKCPSANECIQKLWYIYTTEFYAAESKKKLNPFATPWMELECIMLSEISQALREVPYDLTCKWNLIHKTNQWAKKMQRHWNEETVEQFHF